jgi:hypothetical protein
MWLHAWCEKSNIQFLAFVVAELRLPETIDLREVNRTTGLLPGSVDLTKSKGYSDVERTGSGTLIRYGSIRTGS